jgi:hypothetical protein
MYLFIYLYHYVARVAQEILCLGLLSSWNYGHMPPSLVLQLFICFSVHS